MSEQWKGLHYHDRHVTAARLGRTIVVCELGMACREVCNEAYPCRCCLAAEVERLNRIISESKPWIDMADELADAQAAVQRVREAVAYAERNYDAPIVTIGAIKIALDGGDA